MNLRVEKKSLTELDADLIIVNLFEGVKSPGGATGAVDQALGGAISQMIADGEIEGKLKEAVVFPTFGKLPAKRVLVAGLGKSDEFDLEKVRLVSAAAAKAARKSGARKVASIVHGAGIGGLDPKEAAAALVEGTLMGLYLFERYKEKKEQKAIDEFILCELDGAKAAAVEEGAARGKVMADAVNFARDLVNLPSNDLTPSILAEKALQVARESGFGSTVLERADMEKLGMGALVGVAKGSAEAPKLAVLEYQGNPGSKEVLALVGKGITFDTGGISIKPSEGMEEMKTDMGGAATVLAVMKAIGVLRPKINVMMVIPACENMPSGTAQKPGDVVKAMNGKTIEVINTDAEGRLILADAVAYAVDRGATRLVDVATLTGACVIALGHVATGLITNNEAWADEVKAAAKKAGEKVWELPAFPEYKEQLKSEVADLKNIGGRPAGAITGGLFIGEFVKEVPWVHLDIAGTARAGKAGPLGPSGGTGVMVRTLIEVCLAQAAK